MESPKKLHYLLLKQLERANLKTEDISPDKRGQWDWLLDHISRSYYDHEQDRYLLERSLDISSREMMELNEKLEYAQKIAHLGYWVFDRQDNKLIWSQEMYDLTGMDPTEGAPTMRELLQHIQEDFRGELWNMVKASFEGKKGEMELQFRNPKNKKYYWHYVKCQPEVKLKDGSPIVPIRHVSGIVMDITERKIYEKNAEKIRDRLLAVSRQAGMAEVATSILHNIGNIMNSANVSLKILKENFAQPYNERLFRIAQMIQEHSSGLDTFLTTDPKGKLIPSYLVELINILKRQNKNNIIEINNINENLMHINDIVAMQNTISGTTSLLEKILIPEVIDTALKMSINLSKNPINVKKQYNRVPVILTDKSKLLQIIVNLLLNAKDAVCKNKETKVKKIKIIVKNTQDKIQILIVDNGLGITHKNLTRIFSYGFTTKLEGHGFGLHSSALSARDLGGSLKVESDGPNKGATFIVTLPLKRVRGTHNKGKIMKYREL